MTIEQATVEMFNKALRERREFAQETPPCPHCGRKALKLADNRRNLGDVIDQPAMRLR